MITSAAFAGKKFAVLGLARSGQATVAALTASGAEITAWDSNEEARQSVTDKATVADLLEIDLSNFDAIVVSPGVPLNRHPIAKLAAVAGVPIIGDIELFAMARAYLPAHKVVAITGTNGKSTTTALVHDLCVKAGLPAAMGGNIGLPILSQDALPEGGVYILELSSYQIDLTLSLDCDVAALLNITPDHLDRYDGFQGYADSKTRLFAMQSAGHKAVFGDRDEQTVNAASKVDENGRVADIVWAAANIPTGQEKWPSLQGPHNLQNVAVAAAIMDALGVGAEQWQNALPTFPGLPHRMERVMEFDGILFVNDSKATNPASSAPALAAYNNIHWIVGGLPKAKNLDECKENFGNVKAAYTIGEAGPLFAELLQSELDVIPCELLGTAVSKAAENAVAGDVVLLSPACASFDQFKDFETRGDSFRELCAAIVDAQIEAQGNARGDAL